MTMNQTRTGRTFDLRTKLTAAFLLVTLVLFGLISVFANVLLEKQFEDYIMQQQEKENQAIVDTITSRVSDWGGIWNQDGLELIGVNALERGLMLRVINADGTVLWDAMIHHSGMCASILQGMAERMEAHDQEFRGGYTEQVYPVIADGQELGQVAVGYYGPYSYTASDLEFLDRLNRLLQLAAVIALLLSVVLGLYMARQLSVPIHRVTDAAKKISKGNLRDRIAEPSSTTEIADLTGSINQLAETLEQQDRLRKQLTADVAHELRTPLATLQSHIEALIDGIWEVDEARLQNCHEETLRLTRIVSSLEELTRYDADVMTLLRSRIDLGLLASRITGRMQADFQNKGVVLRADLADGLWVEGDEDKLSQVLINLLANALNYTPSGGLVQLRLSETEESVTVMVEDNGIGIAEDALPHIFERFYRADHSRSRETGGSGIGLAIVKSIVEAHQGEVSVESELGEGSRFFVIFPKKVA